MKKVISTIFICIFALSAVQAQETNGEKKLPKDCSQSYKNWYKKDVIYIITKNETDNFLKLETDEEREIFIENFWRRRDPDPNTEINEFRKEHYERFAFADENFASGIPGWRTDRGRIYIIFGKPDNIEKGRGKFENLENVLFEKWGYERVNGIGKSFETIFVDPTETDEFRFLKEKRNEILEILSCRGLEILYN
jgi:GWxTD domain-containing protein